MDLVFSVLVFLRSHMPQKLIISIIPVSGHGSVLLSKIAGSIHYFESTLEAASPQSTAMSDQFRMIGSIKFVTKRLYYYVSFCLLSEPVN